MSAFTWIPFYKELASKLLAYRGRQGELLALLRELESKGHSVISLKDRTDARKEVPLDEIDPFTFFAVFNRRLKDEKRKAILTEMKAFFGISAAVPSDFDGIPVMYPQKSWFFPFRDRKKPGDIEALWSLAEAIVRKPPAEISPALFNRCLEISQVSEGNLSMGLFWMRPDDYLALDNKNREALQSLGISPAVTDWQTYLSFLEEARQEIRGPFWQFSKNAFDESIRPPQHWVFQANPDYYDTVGALRNGAVESWQVNQHKKDIHPHDKVIIWVTGESAGCYAVATVTSEVHSADGDTKEDPYWKQPARKTAPEGVTLKIDTNLWDRPVSRAALAGQAVFRDFPAGRQGTNLPATRAHYEGILTLARGRAGRHYWVYAPGPDAKYWDECWQKGIMVYGADELSDLSGYPSKNAIEAALKKAKGIKTRPTNDARGAWEFSRVLKPGDVVIAKQGRRQFIGYGVVSGPYHYDSSRQTYRNIREVKWVKKGEWKQTDWPIVVKTLTDITKYPKYVNRLKQLIGIEDVELTTCPVSHPSLNIILYGPPGTGKTWTLRNKYMERFTERAAAVSKEDFAAELVADSAWWQVITMVMLDLKTSKVSGILAHPLMEARIRRANNRTPRAAVWAHLQIHTKADCPEVKYAKRYEPLLFSKDANSVWSIDEKLATEEAPDLVEALQLYRGYKPGQGAVIKRYEFTTFHQSYSYEDFVEGIKPLMYEEVAETLAYEVKPGIFRAIVQRALADPNHDYALLIDEISRGNVANIFGELITLIEDDKRQGAPNELRARLPYSRDEFVVPKNLYIIGAMNTADRSVEALDTALRRRFTFVAVPPQPELIQQPANLDVDLQKLLGVINARIEKLLDKDHCIGHSYFMGIAASSDPLTELRHVFATRILPLMEEYFYGDPAKVGMVLGERFVTRKDDAIEWAEGDWGMDEFEERRVYALRDPMTMKGEDFQAVYE